MLLLLLKLGWGNKQNLAEWGGGGTAFINRKLG